MECCVGVKFAVCSVQGMICALCSVQRVKCAVCRAMLCSVLVYSLICSVGNVQ